MELGGDEQRSSITDEEAVIQVMMDKACKSRAATKGRKPVKDWRQEMETDHDMFLTFVWQTEKYILLATAEEY